MRVSVIGCWGGSPRAGGACSGYLVEHGGFRLLLDCGSGVASRLPLARPLSQVHHVFVSHYHFDHVSDAGVLAYARLVERQVEAGVRAGDARLAAAGVGVGSLDGTPCPSAAVGGTDGPAGSAAETRAAALPELTFYAQAGTPELDAEFARLAVPGGSRAQAVGEGDRLRVGPLALSFMRTRHPVPCLAVRVSAPDGATLAYTADGALTPHLGEFCAGADALVAECSLYPGFDGSRAGHMSCDDVVELARCARPRTLVLSHLPIYGDESLLARRVRAALSADEVDEVALASRPPHGRDMLAFDVVARKG